MIVNSYNMDLNSISLRLNNMSINRAGRGLWENDHIREINAF